MLGTFAVAIVWLLDRDPPGPVLFVVGFLGALLLIFVLFYLRSRPTQSAQTRIWNRLVVSGFLIMLTVAGLFVLTSHPGLAIAVSWLYWFGWTWISWLVAGRLALQDANVVTSALMNVMNPGGSAAMIAHSVAHGLEQEPMDSVSPIIQVGIVRAADHEIKILRRQHQGAWTIAQEEAVQTGQLITDWNSFRAAAGEAGLDAEAAVT